MSRNTGASLPYPLPILLYSSIPPANTKEKGVLKKRIRIKRQGRFYRKDLGVYRKDLGLILRAHNLFKPGRNT